MRLKVELYLERGFKEKEVTWNALIFQRKKV